MNTKEWFQLLKKSFSEWQEDKALKLGAALSYYTVFSLPPLLFLVIAIASVIFSREAVRDGMVAQIQGLVGGQGGEIAQIMIDKAFTAGGAGLIASIVGIVVLLFGATGVFGELQDSLNIVFEVKPKPGSGIKTFLRTRLLSFSLIIAIAFLLLVSLVVSAFLAAFGSYLGGLIGGGEATQAVLYVLNFVVSLAVITFLFALLFKVLPDVKMAWRGVWVGALFTAILFTVGKFLIGFYLGRSAVGSAYGAAGALVLILLWVFYSSQILFFGAEFTQVYARKRGYGVEPADYAEPLEDKGGLRKDVKAPTKAGVLGPEGQCECPA
jgi:membrane protein